MAGYSARQSTFTTGDTITAAHSNNEFNAILAAFHVSTGHKHDGSTAGDGGPISTLFSNAISMGTGADTDIAVTFNANSNDGVITWMEDEDYFQFSDDLLISSTEKIQFRDTALYINSSTDGQLDLVADTKIQLTATTIGLDGAISGTGVADEDNMSSNSATKLATQQSIKAYVDTEISGVSSSFQLEDDDGTEVTISSGKEVKFIGSGITTNWTDTDNGTDGDPYDLTFTVDAAQTGITSLLATDIKIGEDDQTKIDFETADEIHFYAANAEQVYVADGVFGPQTDSDVDLGTTGVRWKDAYIDTVTTTGNVTIGGDLTISGDDLTMATNTAGHLLIADGNNYNPTAVTALSEISSVAGGDTLLAVDATDGALKKITRSTLVAGLATSGAIGNVVEDSTPQLGGDLDVNGNGLVSTSNGNIALTPNGSGVVRIDGNVDIQSGEIILKNSGSVSNIKFYCEVSNAHYTQLQSSAHSDYSGNVTLTLPPSTDTLVGKATTDTLTNKTLTSPVLNTGVSGTAIADEDDMSSNSASKLATQQSIKAYVDAQITAEDLDITSDSGTIAIDLDSETLTIAGGTGIDSSATSNTVTLAIDSTVATLSGTQTLTNKTIDASQLSGTVANARLDAELQALAGLTSAADKGIQFTGSGTAGVYDLTSAGKALLDDADAAAQRTTLGLGTAATQAVGTSASNVVQLDGSAKLPAVDGSALTGLSGGGTETFTAKGDIANGKPVVLTTDGKAEQVVAFERLFNKKANYNVTGVYPSYGKWMTAYNGSDTICIIGHTDNGQDPQLAIGTINSSHEITWGDAISLGSTTIDGVGVYYDPDNSCFVALYNYDGSAAAYAVKITFSGTTPTIAATSSALTTDVSAGTWFMDAVYDVDNNKAYIAFGNPTNRMTTLSLSGTTFTWGGLSSVFANIPNQVHVNHSYTAGSYDVGLLTFPDADNSNAPTAMAYTVSGDTFTFGSKVVLKANENMSNRVVGHSNGIVDGNGIVCAWVQSNGQTKHQYAIITLSGTGNRTVTVTKQDVFPRSPFTYYDQDPETYGSGDSYYQTNQVGVYNTADKQHYIVYNDYSHEYAPKVRIVKYISNTELEIETEYLNDTENERFWSPRVFTSGISNGIIVAAYNRDEGYTQWGGISFITYKHNSTNLNPTNFLGLATEAISDGGSGKITILGGVNASQSSLTPGKAYYISEDASGSAIATQGVRFIGNAFSATKLQVGEETKKAIPTKSNHKIEGEPFIANSAFTTPGQGVAVTTDGSGKVDPLAGPVEDNSSESPGHYNNPDAIDFTNTYTSGTNTYTGTGTSHGNEIRFGHHESNIDYVFNKAVNYDPDQDRMWMIYIDKDDSYIVKHVIALWNPGVYGFDGTTQTNNYLDNDGYGTYSYTTPAQSIPDATNDAFPDSNSSEFDICYDSDNQKWVMVYTDDYNATSLYVRTGTLTGGTTNTLVWSSPVTFTDDHSTRPAYLSIAYNKSEKVVQVAYEDRGDNEYGKLKTISIAANGTPSWNSGSITFEDARVSECALTYADKANRSYVSYQDHGNSSYIKFKQLDYYSGDASPHYRAESEVNTYRQYGYKMSRPIYAEYSKRIVWCFNYNNSVEMYNYTINSSNNLTSFSTAYVLGNTTSTTDTTQWQRPILAENTTNGKITTVWHRSSSYIKYKHMLWTGSGYAPDSGDVRNGAGGVSSSYVAQNGHRIAWHPITNSTRTDGGHMFYAISGNAENQNYITRSGPILQHIDNNHQQYIGLAQNVAAAGEVVYVKTYGMIDSNQRSVSLAAESGNVGLGRAKYPFRWYWDRNSDKITTSNGRSTTGQNQFAGIQLSPEKMMVIFSTGADYDGGTNSSTDILDSLSGPRN